MNHGTRLGLVILVAVVFAVLWADERLQRKELASLRQQVCQSLTVDSLQGRVKYLCGKEVSSFIKSMAE